MKKEMKTTIRQYMADLYNKLICKEYAFLAFLTFIY